MGCCGNERKQDEYIIKIWNISSSRRDLFSTMFPRFAPLTLSKWGSTPITPQHQHIPRVVDVMLTQTWLLNPALAAGVLQVLASSAWTTTSLVGRWHLEANVCDPCFSVWGLKKKLWLYEQVRGTLCGYINLSGYQTQFMFFLCHKAPTLYLLCHSLK